MLKKLSDLNIGDKFWFTDVPYLVIDMDMKNMSLYTDFSKIKWVLCLATYKVVGFNKDIKVLQDTDNFQV
jgi:hypothetical protein